MRMIVCPVAGKAEGGSNLRFWLKTGIRIGWNGQVWKPSSFKIPFALSEFLSLKKYLSKSHWTFLCTAFPVLHLFETELPFLLSWPMLVLDLFPFCYSIAGQIPCDGMHLLL